MMASKSRTPEPVATVAKALATLRSFVDGQSEWGVRELGAALQMPPSTVHRLLSRLRMEGFVGYDSDLQKYKIGFEFARLAAAVMQRHGLRQVALPVMRDLTERTEEGVWLALYDSEQHRIAYIAESESPNASRYIAPLGRVKGLTESACGIAILAAMSSGERQATLRALRLRLSGETGALVSSAESNGYAVMRASEVGSAMMIAAGVRDADGAVPGSIAFVVPMHRLGAGQERRLGGLVREASRLLALRLGTKLLGGASVGSWQDAIGAISGLLREKHPSLEITPALGGGGRNLDDVDRGMGAYGLTVASSLFDAREGRGQFAYRHERLRTVMHLPELQFLIIVRADLHLKRPGDLARLRVSPGEQGFSGAQAFQDVLGVAGVDPGASSRRKGALVYLDYPEGKRQFEAGNVDAVAWMTTVSNPLVRDLETSMSSRLFPLDPGTIKSLLQRNPGYRNGLVRSESCPNWLTADMATLSVPTVLACRADRPEEEVYDLARTIFERRETLGQLSPVYEGLGGDMVLDGLTAPLHPGAERFFKELGIRPRYARIQRSAGGSGSGRLPQRAAARR